MYQTPDLLSLGVNLLGWRGPRPLPLNPMTSALYELAHSVLTSDLSDWDTLAFHFDELKEVRIENACFTSRIFSRAIAENNGEFCARFLPYYQQLAADVRQQLVLQTVSEHLASGRKETFEVLISSEAQGHNRAERDQQEEFHCILETTGFQLASAPAQHKLIGWMISLVEDQVIQICLFVNINYRIPVDQPVVDAPFYPPLFFALLTNYFKRTHSKEWNNKFWEVCAHKLEDNLRGDLAPWDRVVHTICRCICTANIIALRHYVSQAETQRQLAEIDGYFLNDLIVFALETKNVHCAALLFPFVSSVSERVATSAIAQNVAHILPLHLIKQKNIPQVLCFAALWDNSNCGKGGKEIVFLLLDLCPNFVAPLDWGDIEDIYADYAPDKAPYISTQNAAKRLEEWIMEYQNTLLSIETEGMGQVHVGRKI